ncbi:MAG TPA: hypothetical protein DD412_06475, partial [Holosporales bacterium]|nr:hypothetical protein [Holosporales bacterium]
RDLLEGSRADARGLRDSLTDSRSELADSRSELADSRSELADSRSELAGSHTELADSRADASNLSGSLHSTISGLQEEVERLRGHLASSQIARSQAEQERDQAGTLQNAPQIRESSLNTIQSFTGWVEVILGAIKGERDSKEFDESKNSEDSNMTGNEKDQKGELKAALDKISMLQQEIAAQKIQSELLLEEKSDENKLIREQIMILHQNHQVELGNKDKQLGTVESEVHSTKNYIAELHKTLKAQEMRLEHIKELEQKVRDLKERLDVILAAS